MVKYNIVVILPNITLNFNSLDNYEIVNNNFIKLWDKKINAYRIYDSRICEIISTGVENG